MSMPIRLAFIGAGLFVRDSYVPSILRLGDTFQVVAVCSRTVESAQKAAVLFPKHPEIYTDSAALLARDDVEAVAVVLPINALPAAVSQALASGKHVISEKPIAPDVATGKPLLDRQRNGQVWMVAENWRYEDAFLQAAEVVRAGKIGKPVLCHWSLQISMTPQNKYYQTPWRRAGDFPGGFLLDGGVHQMAALRMIFGEIVSVSAFAAQMRADLPPADTLTAALRFESGLIGAFSLTYAVGSNLSQALHVVGEQGTLRVDRATLEVYRDDETRSTSFPQHGIEAELAAFAAAVRDGQPHRSSPREALQDVAVIEALLRSAEQGRAVTPETIAFK
jgi:predicted dehydrogenase